MTRHSFYKNVPCLVYDLLLRSFQLTRVHMFVDQAFYPDKAEHLFQSMRKALCPPSLYTYTALINAHAREGNCVRAEEIFAELQSVGFVPDVYTYNALLEAYRFVASYSTIIDAYFEIFIRYLLFLNSAISVD